MPPGEVDADRDDREAEELGQQREAEVRHHGRRDQQQRRRATSAKRIDERRRLRSARGTAWQRRHGGAHAPARAALTISPAGATAGRQISDEDAYLRQLARRAVLDERVGHPERERRDDRPAQLAEAADDDDQEGVDDVVEPERRADRTEQRQPHAGDPRQARAEDEGRAVDVGVRTPMPAGHLAVLHDRAHAPPGRRALQVDRDRDHHERGDGEDEQARIRHDRSRRPRCRREEARRVDLDVGCAEQVARELLQHKLTPQVTSSVSSGRP